MKNETLRGRTTTASHGNRNGRIKNWIDLFFKTRTRGHFPAKYHGCCAMRDNFWVEDVVSGDDY